MPRKSRIDAPGALHHVIVRGIDRQEIFSDDIDRRNFLERLGDILTDTNTACYAWALIPNHSSTAANFRCSDIDGDATAFSRLYGKLQSAAPALWSFISEPLQIHFVSGRYLPFGVGALHSSSPC